MQNPRNKAQSDNAISYSIISATSETEKAHSFKKKSCM